MQETVFKRELNKYRVVRRDDHHKVRWKKMKETVSPSSSSKAAAKKNNKKLAAVATMNLDTEFWKDLQEKASSVLSADECKRFMTTIQNEYPKMIGKVNFEDLEAGLSAASK
jgi:hypothetical protein